MPLASKKLSRNRQEFRGAVSASEVQSLIGDADLRVLQASSEVETGTWELLNAEFFSKRHDVELRVYGFYSSVCDLSFLSKMREVRHFSADCLTKARGIEHVADLPKLESLSVGIFNLESFDFLAGLPANQIQKLGLELTKSKRPSLELLQRFKNLKTLYLEGQQKGIEVISTLTALEDLTLRSISPSELNFLRNLSRLWSLDIKLGGVKDLSALRGMNQVKYLELWQVKGLSDITPISDMLGLQYLFLQSLRNVAALPDFSKLPCLRRIYLENMKGLTDVSSAAAAPALEEFAHASASGMEPEDYDAILKGKCLRAASVWFGSDKKNERFRQLAASHGVADYEYREFTFR
jgi:hypothetical protein